MMRQDLEDNFELILEMIDKHFPKIQISKALNCNYKTLNNFLKRKGIDYKGNQMGKGIPSGKKLPIEDYLTNKVFIRSHKLKLRLLDEGYKDYCCEMCKQSTWLDKPIPLELHHVDGNPYNNRLENIQLLCANCHAFTDNYKGRNVKTSPTPKDLKNFIQQEFEYEKPVLKKPKKISKKTYRVKCQQCGTRFEGNKKVLKRKFCSETCCQVSLRKSIRPTKGELHSLLCEKSFLEVSRMFHVSDNTIRKWCKQYEIPHKAKDYKKF